MSYANYRHVKRVGIVRSMSDLASHRALIPAFRTIARQAAGSGLVDPLSASILERVSPSSFIPSVLLAVFLCRFSELRTLSLASISKGKNIQIRQSKTKTIKRVSSDVFERNIPAPLRKDGGSLCVVTYVRLAKDIRLAAVRAGITLPDKAKSETHIFRHLYASWAMMKGFDEKLTAKRLGHSGIAAIASYQHPWASLHYTFH